MRVSTSALILDIFAPRPHAGSAAPGIGAANTAPRLARMWAHRGRWSEGSERGPGRDALRSIAGRSASGSRLKRDLKGRPRARSAGAKGLLRLAVGYTNAGKSTLQRARTRQGLRREPALRHARSDDTRHLVGGVQLLPPTPSDSFETPATVARSARPRRSDGGHLLLHVVDATEPDPTPLDVKIAC